MDQAQNSIKMVYIKQQDLNELDFTACRNLSTALAAGAGNSLLDIQGLISIRVKSSTSGENLDQQATAGLIDHMSAGNQGFFAVITDKRTMRIYWPQIEEAFSEHDNSSMPMEGVTLAAN